VLIKYVTPLLVETTTSELFIVDTGDYRVEGPVKTDMTETASSFCFNELATRYDEMNDINPSTIKHTAWSLGGYRYIVNANIPATQSSDNKSRTMVCEITYDYSSETPNSADSWSVTGFSYNTTQ
jgi:broad specificity polyphosphatase/5'/3'-nucleotidase SurE